MVPQPDGIRRPPGVDVPPTRLGAALELLEDLDRIREGGDELMRGVEEATGLRLGEVQVLEVVSAGADHVRAVARRTGQPVEAARATVRRLVNRELLGRHHHRASGPAARPSLLHVTEGGRAVLGQVEGMRLRLTEALLASVGRGESEHLRETVRALSSSLAVRGELPPAS
ncbi:MAG: hypothetical protein ACRDO8_08265 [Nocardioidaceae bacterium]